MTKKGYALDAPALRLGGEGAEDDSCAIGCELRLAECQSIVRYLGAGGGEQRHVAAFAVGDGKLEQLRAAVTRLRWF